MCLHDFMTMCPKLLGFKFKPMLCLFYIAFFFHLYDSLFDIVVPIGIATAVAGTWEDDTGPHPDA